MSDNDGTKAKSGWTDKERLTHLFALIDNSNVKFDHNATPRPAGRSIIACQRMMERLKGTLRNELEALKSGLPINEGTPKKAAATSKPTPRKRKTKDNDDADGSLIKRGRKKKGVVDGPLEEEHKLKAEDEMLDEEA